MDPKLEALTRKLYDEGVQKAEAEAQRIIAGAQKEAEEIRIKAERQSVDILSRAQDDALALQRRTRSELQMMATQAKERVRQELEQLLAGTIIDTPVGEAMRDQQLIQHLIREMVSRMQLGAHDALQISLPEEAAREWGALLRQQLHDTLQRDTTVIPVAGMKAGFQIGRAGQHYKLSFSEEDFRAYLRQFLSREYQDLIEGGQA